MRNVGKVIFLTVVLCGSVFAQEQLVVTTNSVAESLAAIDIQAYNNLKAENDALRRENQMLRRELVAKKGALPDTLLPDKVVEPDVKIEVEGADTGYWLSQKSKIRHNKKCRNYRKVKGRPCGPEDGKPCKMCGG